jgi:hypothetical protein
MIMKKLPVCGSATLDSAGIFLSEKGAVRFAQKNMPRDLKAAGFKASVCLGQDIFEGKYRDGWRVNYGK